jgi:hypothetical protein
MTNSNITITLRAAPSAAQMHKYIVLKLGFLLLEVLNLYFIPWNVFLLTLHLAQKLGVSGAVLTFYCMPSQLVQLRRYVYV